MPTAGPWQSQGVQKPARLVEGIERGCKRGMPQPWRKANPKHEGHNCTKNDPSLPRKLCSLPQLQKGANHQEHKED